MRLKLCPVQIYFVELKLILLIGEYKDDNLIATYFDLNCV
jgi:hypothetical protein